MSLLHSADNANLDADADQPCIKLDFERAATLFTHSDRLLRQSPVAMDYAIEVGGIKIDNNVPHAVLQQQIGVAAMVLFNAPKDSASVYDSKIQLLRSIYQDNGIVEKTNPEKVKHPAILHVNVTPFSSHQGAATTQYLKRFENNN